MGSKPEKSPEEESLAKEITPQDVSTTDSIADVENGAGEESKLDNDEVAASNGKEETSSVDEKKIAETQDPEKVDVIDSHSTSHVAEGAEREASETQEVSTAVHPRTENDLSESRSQRALLSDGLKNVITQPFEGPKDDVALEGINTEPGGDSQPVPKVVSNTSTTVEYSELKAKFDELVIEHSSTLDRMRDVDTRFLKLEAEKKSVMAQLREWKSRATTLSNEKAALGEDLERQKRKLFNKRIDRSAHFDDDEEEIPISSAGHKSSMEQLRRDLDRADSSFAEVDLDATKMEVTKWDPAEWKHFKMDLTKTAAAGRDFGEIFKL